MGNQCLLSCDLSIPDNHAEKYKHIIDAVEPVGHKVLIKLPSPKKKTGGGIFIPDTLSDPRAYHTKVGTVVNFGPDCFCSPKMFPSGPTYWFGDNVIFSGHLVDKFPLSRHDSEDEIIVGFIDDDQVIGICHDDGLSKDVVYG